MSSEVQFIRGRLQTIFSKITSLWRWGGGGLATWRFVCQQNVGIYRRVRHKRNLVHCREKSNLKSRNPTKSRNPVWNPEIQSEIQKSTLKSRNPLWNSEIQSNDPPRISVYFKLITSLCLHGRVQIMYDVNIRSNDLCTRPIFARGQRSFLRWRMHYIMHV